MVDPLLPLVVESLVDATKAVSSGVKQTTAWRTLRSYPTFAMATQAAVPLLLMCSSPSISQAQPKQPEIEAHLATQLGEPLSLEEPTVIATTSGPTGVVAKFTTLVEALQGVSSSRTSLVESLQGVTVRST